MRLNSLIFSLVFCGCASEPAVTYKVSPDGSAQVKADAERAHAAASPSSSSSQVFDTPPRILVSHFPEYPESFRRANVTGRVVLRFTVGEDGKVSDPSVVGTPPPELAALSLHAIMRWKFTPATKGGLPVSARVQQAFNFELK